MKRLLYIYNPNAGRQRSRAILSEALEAMSAQGYELTVHPTAAQGDAAETVRLHAAEYDRVVCCGGDGTLNETVSGLLALPEESRPVLGYLPMGSTNDFARSLGLPKDIKALARTACAAPGEPVDIGRCADRSFTYVSAFGLFTEVSYSTPQSMKNILGHFSYVLEGAGQLMNVPSYRMTVVPRGGTPITGDFIYGMVGNTLSVGGVMRLPKDHVKLNDGQFEVMLVRKFQNLADWQNMISAVTAMKFPSHGTVETFNASEIVFQCDEALAWTVDGEFGGRRAETVVRALPGAVRIAY